MHLRSVSFVTCLIIAASATVLQAVDPITLTYPMEREVFQRDAKDKGQIKIEGNVPAGADLIEARCEQPAAKAPAKPAEWTRLAGPDQFKDARFSAELSMPAGGWYKLEVRAKAKNAVLATATVERVGVGDVFITAGQSNSANFGAKQQSAKDPRVVYFDGKMFIQATDPIPGGFGAGGSPWALLGDQIIESTGVPVCFRSVTLSYSPVKEWMKDGAVRFPYYKTMLERAGWFGKNGVRAVLWHQGESDGVLKTSADDYCKQLQSVIETMRKDIGYPVEWFVAGASLHTGATKEAQEQVAKGQHLIWERKIAFKGPVTDELVGPKLRSDGVHFTELGLKAHADLWFKAMAAQYGWKVPADPSNPSPPKSK